MTVELLAMLNTLKYHTQMIDVLISKIEEELKGRQAATAHASSPAPAAAAAKNGARGPRKRIVSKAARDRMAEAQRKRWEAVRQAKAAKSKKRASAL
jgi:hypothetical protein